MTKQQKRQELWDTNRKAMINPPAKKGKVTNAFEQMTKNLKNVIYAFADLI